MSSDPLQGSEFLVSMVYLILQRNKERFKENGAINFNTSDEFKSCFKTPFTQERIQNRNCVLEFYFFLQYFNKFIIHNKQQFLIHNYIQLTFQLLKYISFKKKQY